jgi:transcription factor MBP1
MLVSLSLSKFIHVTNSQEPAPVSKRMSEDYDNISAQLNDDETPDDTTVASASFLGDDDRYDMSQQSTGHRKRKRDDQAAPSLTDQNHIAYSDELLDYFMLAQADESASRPEPPPNFQPDWVIDQDGHTAMHWACAMGDIEVMKQLKRFGATLAARNVRGETPLMRAVLFTNCQDKQSMPKVVQEMIGTIDAVDYCNATAIHHAAAMTASRSKHQCARYYLDVILNKLSETLDQEEIHRLLDIQDVDGNTACHIAAKNKARKCVRALIGRGASTDIPNHESVTAEELIQELNSTRRERNLQASSSPFAPDSQRHISFQEPLMDNKSRHPISHHSEAAMTMEQKVTPLMLEKFQDLAKSFDEELIDRDHSEKEAKRILNSTLIELATIREQILALSAAEEDDSVRANEESQLQHAQASIISLIEQQQQLRLAASIHHEDSMMNGHLDDDDADSDLEHEQKMELYGRLEEEQRKRLELVEEYVGALGMAGMGEKGELYRNLTTRCLGLKGGEVDEQIDGLIAVLEEDRMDEVGRDPILLQ